MSAPSAYTDTELEALRGAAFMSGVAIIFCEITLISSAIEFAALTKELKGAAKNHPDSALIQLLFGDYGSGKGDFKEPQASSDITPTKVMQMAIEYINRAIIVLREKGTPEELQEYKEFIYSCADRVANAAGEGLFGTGEKVSRKEAATLEKLKAALSL